YEAALKNNIYFYGLFRLGREE
ncbi:HAD family hydrolase, partial [Campylobacter coli]|nr:HAD family hydrolase [Campylobacter coli]ECC0429091.1 HAD family hydrolase [Campylobacter coli]